MQRTIFVALLVLCVAFTASFAQYHNNQAASFNGTNGYIAVPSQTELSPTAAITIEMWIQPRSTSTTQAIVGKDYATSYSLGFNPPGRPFFYPRGGSLVSAKASTILSTNTWTHLAATYNGTTTAIYINGVLDTSTTAITGAIGTNTDSLRIGCEGPTPGYFFNGYIDELRIWNVARSAAEIARDRFIPLAMIAVGAIPAGSYNGLAAAWRFNGDALDEAGLAANHGTARNMSYLDLRQKPVNYVDYNNALLLDGLRGYCAAFPSTSFGATTAVTIEAWIKRDTIGTGQPVQVIVSKCHAAVQNYYLFWNDRRIGLGINSTFQVATDTIVNTNRWYHIAASYNSVDGRSIIYVNGDSVASGVSATGAIQNDLDSVYVGATTQTPAYKFKGQIDQVRIWKDVVRTRGQIRSNMYNSIDFSTAPPPGNVTAYGFDGRNSTDMVSVGSVPHLDFNGTARLTSAHRQLNAEPTSPLLRDDGGGFGGPTYVVSRRQLSIPDNSPTGVTDSVSVSASGTATGVRLFVLLDHTYTGDLTITLTGPTGVSANVFTQRGGGNNDIMTIFSDNADSLAGPTSTAGFLAPFSPLVKPNNPLSAFVGAPRQGWWKLKVVDGASADIGVVYGWGVQTSPLVGVEGAAELADKFELMQNYPNPFNPTTTIKFTIPKESEVNIGVYDILGRLVTTLMNEPMRKGSYSVLFNGSGFASGTYFYRITAGQHMDTKKMMILK